MLWVLGSNLNEADDKLSLLHQPSFILRIQENSRSTPSLLEQGPIIKQTKDKHLEVERDIAQLNDLLTSLSILAQGIRYIS